MRHFYDNVEEVILVQMAGFVGGASQAAKTHHHLSFLVKFWNIYFVRVNKTGKHKLVNILPHMIDRFLILFSSLLQINA
jgi:hypothetical protein